MAKSKSSASASTSTSASASAKVAAPAKDVVVSNSDVAPVNTVVENVSAPAEVSLSDAFTDILNQLNAFRTQITTLSTQLRTLRSRSEREIRTALKNQRKRRTTNRKPSGFVKPTLISPELASFLGKPKGSEMARTDVTREINQYIRSNKLQDPENGRRIIADAKLRKLLKLGKNDELTYFNLQRFMSPHFTKTVVEQPSQ